MVHLSAPGVGAPHSPGCGRERSMLPGGPRSRDHRDAVHQVPPEERGISTNRSQPMDK